MQELVEIHPKDIPLNSIIKDSLFDKRGVLLAKRNTVVDQGIYDILQHYEDKVKVWVSDELLSDLGLHKENDDVIFELKEEIKKQTLEGVQYIYNSTENPKEMCTAANDIAENLLGILKEVPDAGFNLEMIKISDEYTFKHSVDVGTMGMLIGKRFGLSRIMLRDVALAGVLHDIGKTKIPDEVLNKPAKLTDDEFKVMRSHTALGYEMIKDVDYISEDVKLGVLEHHENVDGSGYPLGLNNGRISKIARILTVADVYDALVTKRVYKAGKSPSESIEMMMAMVNKFDHEVLNNFMGCVILHPVGSVITLSDGKLYQVVKNQDGYPLRPVVKSLETGEERDLLHDIDCLSLVIK